MAYPQWATTERQAYLIELFKRSGGFCIYGHKPCPYPEHHFENHIERLIRDWIEDDREERTERLQMEQEVLHSTPDRTGCRRHGTRVNRRESRGAVRPIGLLRKGGL